MQYCGRCGEMIQGAGFPREIRISSSSWVSTATNSRSVRFTNSVKFGRRTVCAACASQLDRWRLLKWSALGSGAAVFATMIVLSNSTPRSDSRVSDRTASSPQYTTSSPQPQAPAVAQRPILAPPTSQPVGPPDAYTLGRDSRTPDQQGMTPLESTLDRLRQTQPPNPNAAEQQPAPTPMPLRPDPDIQQQVWPHRTATGTRWRLQLLQGQYHVLIDLGMNQIATVRVAPQFRSLPLDAMNVRVDHVQDVIASEYSLTSGAYVFTRDGNVYPER